MGARVRYGAVSRLPMRRMELPGSAICGQSVAQIKKSAQSVGISSTRIDDVDRASNATTLTLLGLTIGVDSFADHFITSGTHGIR